MKKTWKGVCLLTILTIGIVGCQTSTSSSHTSDSSSSLNSWQSLSTNSVMTGCTIGGVLIDVGVGIAIETDLRYGFHCTPTTVVSSSTLNFTISHPDVLEAGYEEGKGYYLFGKKNGDSILSIRNSNNELMYREVVRVREKYSVEEMTDYLITVDSFTSSGLFNYQFDLLFTDGSNGVMTGNDSGTNIGRLKFTYSFLKEDTNLLEYIFKIETIDQGPTTLAPKFIYIYRNGAALHLLDNNGAIDVFFPVIRS